MPHYDRCALITIDVQCDTLDGGPAEIPGTSAAVLAIARVAETFRAAGGPIYHAVRLYQSDGSNVDLCRRSPIEAGEKFFMAGSTGSGLAPELSTVAPDARLLLTGEFQHVGDREMIFYKPRWGAFFETNLEERLRAEGIDTLVFAGCNFPNCPRTSIYEASERDFRIVLVTDAMSRIYDRGVDELRAIGVAMAQTTELAALLGPQAAAA